MNNWVMQKKLLEHEGMMVVFPCGGSLVLLVWVLRTRYTRRIISMTKLVWIPGAACFGGSYEGCT